MAVLISLLIASMVTQIVCIVFLNKPSDRKYLWKLPKQKKDENNI